MPIGPAAGLLLGLHAFAAVVLYLALLAEGAGKSSPPPGRAYQ